MLTLTLLCSVAWRVVVSWQQCWGLLCSALLCHLLIYSHKIYQLLFPCELQKLLKMLFCANFLNLKVAMYLETCPLSLCDVMCVTPQHHCQHSTSHWLLVVIVSKYLQSTQIDPSIFSVSDIRVTRIYEWKVDKIIYSWYWVLTQYAAFMFRYFKWKWFATLTL